MSPKVTTYALESIKQMKLKWIFYVWNRFHFYILTTVVLSWNCWQNVDEFLWHFGFVADFSKIVCWLMIFGNYLCLSRVSTLCRLHQHMTLLYCFFICKYFIAIFAKQSTDVSRIWIHTERNIWVHFRKQNFD